MIVEVNNTFDERRMYFLKPPAATNSDTKPGHDVARDLMGIAEEILPKGQAANLQSTVFSDAWSKDFHVSPFNDREGSYSLAAHDPLTKSNKSRWIVDNTVILRSPEARPKIVARVFADGDPLDPQSASQLDLYRFVLRWCWVGFITFPRIIKEAYKLYFKRSLPVWYRPEIEKRSIARHPTSSEW
ncbi:MAG: hypothetical protein M1822_006404 [Bathelium mastoideum]|nr:MAG: hypothetical protein M1822_006404 [Bathelium mastoideum]